MNSRNLGKNLAAKIILALGTGMFSLMPMVQALPTEAETSTAAIAVSGNTMTINGAANNVINWQSFSIGKNEIVNFANGQNYLNLVKGPDMSSIFGTLNGSGNIYIINPNGILFGSGATINVGALTASTAPLNTVNTAAFLNGENDVSVVLTGNVTSRRDISVAPLANVASAGQLILNAEEVVLQNTAVLDRVTNITGASKLIIGGEEAAVTAAVNTAKGNGRIDGNPELTVAKIITDVNEMRADLSGTYLLDCDINLNGVEFDKPIGIELDECENWNNIGFTGYFNGMGHTIKNLQIDTTPIISYWGETGLFSTIGTYESIGANGVIFTPAKGVRNLVLADVSVVNTRVDGDASVGGLAGIIYDEGVVSNISVSGSVTGYNAGGIAGQVITDGNAAMAHLSSSATVTGEDSAGGIVGMVQPFKGENYNVIIYNAKNTGNVNGEINAGGIVGYWWGSEGTIRLENAFNTGNISSDGLYDGIAAGGIIGCTHAYDNSNVLELKHVFNAGTVTGADIKEYPTNEKGEITDWSTVTGTHPHDHLGGIVGRVWQMYGSTITPEEAIAKVSATDAVYVKGNVQNSTGAVSGTPIGTPADSVSQVQSMIDSIWVGGNKDASNAQTAGGNSSSGNETVQTGGETAQNSGTIQQGGAGNAAVVGSYGNVLQELFADMPFDQQKELILGVENNMVVIMQKQNQDFASTAITLGTDSNPIMSNKAEVVEISDTAVNLDDNGDKEKENNSDDKEAKE